MILEAYQDRPRRRNPLLMPVRFLLYWVVKALVLLYLGIRFLLRPRAVRYGLLILLVGSAVAWKAVGAPALLSASSSGEPQMVSTTITTQLPRPAAPEQYFKAQAAYDASGMWETMSDQLRSRMIASTNSKEQLQKVLDTSRQQQRRYSSVAYVGGVPLDGGRNAYFYVLTVEDPNASSHLPYTFVVDQSGKISNIQWSMDR